MVTRCESRHRIYTELCNRSSTTSLGLSHGGSPMLPNCGSCEDYWEDASVSLRSCQGWEISPCPWLGTSGPPALEKVDAQGGSQSFSGLHSDRILHRSCSSGANACMASLKASGRRSFPPPLASCSTLSIKGGGRFVLKEMDADRPQGFFRAQRGDGRLLLELILPEEGDDEEDSDEEGLSPVEDMAECGEADHGEHCSHCQEATSGIHEQSMDVLNTDFDVSAAAQRFGFRNVEVEGEVKSSSDGILSEEPNRVAGFPELDSYLADNGLTFGRFEFDQLVASGASSHVEQEPLWNVEARNQALASLSPWSANQMCVHQPIAHIRPALGLAMS